jgi:DNA-binding response OmpR family regulator
VAPTLSAAAAPAAQTAPPAEAEEGLMVDVAMRRVRVNGRPVELTPKEFDLLALFAQNPGRPFSRDDLLDRIWKNDYEVTDRTIDTHVQRLRKKLGNQAGVIQTVWGVGYRFEESRATATGRGEPGTEGEAPPQGW